MPFYLPTLVLEPRHHLSTQSQVLQNKKRSLYTTSKVANNCPKNSSSLLKKKFLYTKLSIKSCVYIVVSTYRQLYQSLPEDSDTQCHVDNRVQLIPWKWNRLCLRCMSHSSEGLSRKKPRRVCHCALNTGRTCGVLSRKLTTLKAVAGDTCAEGIQKI